MRSVNAWDRFTVSLLRLALIGCCVFGPLNCRLPAAEPSSDNQKLAERPWIAAWMSSLARVLAACDIIYESVGRTDLADSLESRQTFYREFQGLDRTRPLGLMWAWDDKTTQSAIMFFPIQQIDELMKTVTLNGVVGYHAVNENQYEIERPGEPYHAVLRSGYLLMGEEVPMLQAMSNAPDRITRELKDKYDLVLIVDQRQATRVSKQLWVDAIRNQFEPWLQPQDDEPVESAVVRRALGKALLDLVERLIMDVQTVTVGIRIDRQTYQLQLDLTLQAEQGSAMAAALNRLVVRRSEFSALVNKNASAGLAINWPVTVLGKELPGVKGNDVKNERLDAGVQVVGSDWGDMTVIAGIRGAEAMALNATIPHLLNRLEKTQQITTLNKDVATYRKVALHRIVPAKVPDLLQAFVASGFEVLVGQGKETVWVAMGNPMTLLERLQAAVDAVEETPAAQKSGSIMQGRMSMSKWPSVVPIVDPNVTKRTLEKSKDGFSITVQPISNGIRFQLAAEEGLLQVIGHHWARQVDGR